MARFCIVVGLIAQLLLMGGCDRHIESRDPIRSLPAPTATPVNLAVVINHQSVTVSWEVSDPSGIDRFRVYSSTDSLSGFAVIDSTAGNSVTISGLAVSQAYFFQVASVTAAGVESSRSETISARTGVLDIAIANGLKYTNDRNVSIRLLSVGPTSHVTLSEDNTFADSVLLIFASQVNFQLSNGDGLKTVYARYTFADGSRSGDPISDDIILDTRARIESVSFAPYQSLFATGDTIWFSLEAGEAEGEASVSFPGVSGLPLYDDGAGGDVTSDDSVFTGWWVVPLDFSLSEGLVTGRFIDEAGNSALPVTALERLNAAGNPVPVELNLVEALSSFEIRLSWSPAAGSNVSLLRIFRDTDPAVTDNSDLVATLTNTNATSYVDSTLDDNTMYYYRVYLRDNFSRDTASNILGTQTLINAPPTAVTVAGSYDPDSVTVRLTWSLNGDHDFESYRVYRDTTDLVSPLDQLVGYVNNQAITTATDFIPFSFDSVFYRVYVYDRHGMETGSNVVRFVQ